MRARTEPKQHRKTIHEAYYPEGPGRPPINPLGIFKALRVRARMFMEEVIMICVAFLLLIMYLFYVR